MARAVSSLHQAAAENTVPRTTTWHAAFSEHAVPNSCTHGLINCPNVSSGEQVVKSKLVSLYKLGESSAASHSREYLRDVEDWHSWGAAATHRAFWGTRVVSDVLQSAKGRVAIEGMGSEDKVVQVTDTWQCMSNELGGNNNTGLADGHAHIAHVLRTLLILGDLCSISRLRSWQPPGDPGRSAGGGMRTYTSHSLWLI